MEDDDQSSNDVVIIDNNKEINNTPDGPIIELLRNLITNDNKQNTILTNAQLLEILQKEFQMNVRELHELEVEIYLNVMKKYLKDWPEWDEFDQAISKCKEVNNEKAIMDILQEKYSNLKQFLKAMLEIAQSLAPNTVNKLPEKKDNKSIKSVNNDKNDVVMEVQASRMQLNHLIYRYPKPNNLVFNVEEPFPASYYSMDPLPITSIMNWWGVKVEVKVKMGIFYLDWVYENMHRLKHTLVNKKLPSKNENTISLNCCVQVKKRKAKLNKTQEEILRTLDEFIEFGKYVSWKPIVIYMRTLLVNLFKHLPPNISLPADYRKYLNKYCYVRYLYEDVTGEVAEEANKFDLQLEETVSPLAQLYLGFHRGADSGNSVKITCSMCQETFTGVDLVDDVQNHFQSHNIEPDWQCMNCKKTFKMSSLTQDNWFHDCKSSTNSTSLR